LVIIVKVAIKRNYGQNHQNFHRWETWTKMPIKTKTFTVGRLGQKRPRENVRRL